MATGISLVQGGLSARTQAYIPPAFGGSARAAEGSPGTPASSTSPPPSDSASFSPEALQAARTGPSGKTGESDAAPQAPKELDDREQQEVEKLQQRDREVRQHEQAHVAAAGRYARGGAQFEFTRGPDGRQYATGGEVSIDVTPESSPAATIAKAAIVRRAALAPGEPSAQDRRVAAQASQLELEARRQLAEQRVNEARAAKEDGGALAAVKAYESSPGGAGPATLDLKG